jgi:hypothetical protein
MRRGRTHWRVKMAVASACPQLLATEYTETTETLYCFYSVSFRVFRGRQLQFLFSKQNQARLDHYVPLRIAFAN